MSQNHDIVVQGSGWTPTAAPGDHCKNKTVFPRILLFSLVMESGIRESALHGDILAGLVRAIMLRSNAAALCVIASGKRGRNCTVATLSRDAVESHSMKIKNAGILN